MAKRRSTRTLRQAKKATFGILAVVALVPPALSGARAAPEPVAATDTAAGFDSSAEGHDPRDTDNRDGVAAPTADQRAAARQTGTRVRWNALGTPHALGPVPGGLATRLAADPETAARQYLTNSTELFGLDADAVAGMEPLLVRPIGAGAVVVMRQRFGGLPAGRDGQVAVLVKNGTVVHVSSSLSRDTSAPANGDAGRAPTRSRSRPSDAGLTPAQVPARTAVRRSRCRRR